MMPMIRSRTRSSPVSLCLEVSPDMFRWQENIDDKLFAREGGTLHGQFAPAWMRRLPPVRSFYTIHSERASWKLKILSNYENFPTYKLYLPTHCYSMSGHSVFFALRSACDCRRSGPWNRIPIMLRWDFWSFLDLKPVFLNCCKHTYLFSSLRVRVWLWYWSWPVSRR